MQKQAEERLPGEARRADAPMAESEPAAVRFPRLSALAAEVHEATEQVAEHMKESKALECLRQKESECNIAARSYLLKGGAFLSLGTFFTLGVMPHNAASWAPFVTVEPIMGAGILLAGIAFTCVFFEKATLAEEYAEMRRELSSARESERGAAEDVGIGA